MMSKLQKHGNETNDGAESKHQFPRQKHFLKHLSDI